MLKNILFLSISFLYKSTLSNLILLIRDKNYLAKENFAVTNQSIELIKDVKVGTS